MRVAQACQPHYATLIVNRQAPFHVVKDTLYMNSVKTKTKNVLLAVYTALYSLHSELYAAKHMHSSTETLIREKNGSSCTKLNVLAIIENTASSLALLWIELALPPD